MIRQGLLLIVFLIALGVEGVCQEHFVVKENTRSEWLVFEEGNYVPYQNLAKRTIYFWIDQKRFAGDHLVIASDNNFSVLINNSLVIDKKKSSVLPIDSLSTVFQTSLVLIAIHQQQKINDENLTAFISTKTILSSQNEESEHMLRKGTFFRDFVVTAILVLFVFLISVVRLNPRLSSNYFSVTKIFSLRDTDDDQVYYRLTSGNILFYVFTSLILAFYLIVINQFIETGLHSIKTLGYFATLLTWLKVSLVIFTFLFLKMLIIYLIASLFGVRDVAGIHFFNFISLLLVFMGLLTLSLTVYYLLHGHQNGFYSFLYQMLIWILGGWVVLLFLKLTNRVEHSVFHLFSYICATEIIPFLLIVKVLNE